MTSSPKPRGTVNVIVFIIIIFMTTTKLMINYINIIVKVQILVGVPTLLLLLPYESSLRLLLRFY